MAQHGGVGRVVVGGGAGVQAVVGDGHLSAAVLWCPRLQLAHPAAQSVESWKQGPQSFHNQRDGAG